jgi:hypothetical protein
MNFVLFPSDLSIHSVQEVCLFADAALAARGRAATARESVLLISAMNWYGFAHPPGYSDGAPSDR